MTTDRELIIRQANNFTRMAGVSSKLRDALEHLEAFRNDGYPTSAIGASDPTPGPLKVYEGRCTYEAREYNNGPDDKGPVIRCTNQRPCERHDTPVQSSVLEQAAFASENNDRRIIAEFIATVQRALDRVEPVLRKHQPPLKQAILCSRGQGREGYIEWTDPLCERLPADDRGGLCYRCAKAEQRWRIEHGLPSRRDTAA